MALGACGDDPSDAAPVAHGTLDGLGDGDSTPAGSTTEPSSPTAAGSSGAEESTDDATATADTSTTNASDTTGSEGTGSTGARTKPQARILMLGNSYTQVNGLAGLIDAMAADHGLHFEIEAITQGGATVADLLARPDIQTALIEERWDHVVIQGQSYEPLIQPTVFSDAAFELATLAQGSGAEPVFFETWARLEGSELYDEVWSGGDPEGMQALLHDGYAQAALDSGGTLAPVGQAWALSLSDSPSIVLHSGDGSHPQLTGSYLAAAVFFRVLAGEPAADTDWAPRALRQADAEVLRAHADAAVDARTR